MSHPLYNPYASGNQSLTLGHDMQSIPGLGNYDYAGPDKPTESSRPKETAESAANILLRFGLEKQDLDYLLFYPEDQLTPANLPFILRQIRIQKTKSATSAVQSVPCSEPQPTRSVGEIDIDSLSSSGGAGMSKEQMSMTVYQPVKVIDYGPTGKYTVGVGEDIGRTNDSRANSGGRRNIFRHSQEPLQNNTTEVKSTALGSSCERASSVTSLSSLHSLVLSSVAPPSSDPNKRLQTQPNETQNILSSSLLPMKDTDISVLKTEDSKTGPSNEPVADCKSALKTDSNGTSGIKDQIKTQGQSSAVAEQMKKQQTQQTQKQPSLQTGQEIRPPVLPAVKSVPPDTLIPSITDGSQAMQGPVFIPTHGPPALPQPIPDHMTLLTSAKVAVSKAVPSLAMIHDYVAVWPKIFPHTCSLCNKDFHHMKDWLSHQSTSLHLENCKLLRKQYPGWNGGIALGPRTAGTDVKPSASTSAKTSQHRLHKTRHGSNSRSRSPSPRRPYGSESRREKCSSRSRSPHSSRSSRRSRSHSHSPCYDRLTSSCYRPCSGSPERQLLPRRRDKKRSTPRNNDEHRSSPRKSCERHSPHRRRDKKCSPPRRSNKRWFSPRRSNERWFSPRRSNERWFLPRRSDNRQSPQRSSRERRSSTEESSPKRKKSSSAERLAKKLLETPAVQSLSNSSDLEAVVKALAPALLAELGKMTSTSSSSSSSTAKEESSAKPSKAAPSLQKSLPSSTTKTQETDSKEQRQPPQKKPATSRDTRPQATTSTTTTKKDVPSRPNIPPLTGPLPCGAKNTASSKLNNQKISAEGSVKGTAIINSIVCVSKAKNISTKQIPKSFMLTAQGPKPKTEFSQMQQAAGCPTAAAVEAKLSGGAVELKTMQEAVQSLSKQSHTEAMVKTLAPDLRNELDKMKSSSSSSSSSTAKEESSAKPSKAPPSLQKILPSCSTNTKAITCFEKEEDDKKMKSAKSLILKGITITVFREKETDSKEQKTSPQTKPATSSDRTPQTTTSTTTTRKVVLKKAARGKFNFQKIAAKGSVKGSAFIKSVVCVSKAKNIITKQIAKTAKTGKCPAKGAVKKTVVKNISSKSTARGGETKTESSQMQQHAAGRPTEAAVEAKLPGGGLEIKTVQKTVQSLSKQSHMEAVVKTLVPDLRDELDKMKFSSSSSSSCTAKEESSADPSEATPSLQKSVSSSTTTTKSGKSSPPTTVRLEGIHSCVPHNDVIVSLEHFGKTKSVVLFESKREQTAGRPTEAAVEANLPAGQMETKTVQKAFQSLSEQSHMDVVVKALAPDLQDELDKMKFSSSSSSSYTAKEESSADPSKAPPSLQKSVSSSTTTTKFGKSLPPTMVRLKEICSSLSHSDVIVAVEHFGKTKSVLLFRSKLEAVVCFEKEEDANKLKSAKSLNVKGTVITVVREKETDSKEQTQPPQKKPATSSVSTPQTTTSTTTTKKVVPSKFNRPPVKESLASGAKEATISNFAETEAPQMQQQAARQPVEAAVEAKTVQKDPVAAGKTQTDAASAKAASLTSEPTAAAVTEQLPAASTSSSAVTPLTLGEMVEKHLDPKRIMYLKLNSYSSPDYFKYGKKLLLITGLPEYHDGCYTEDELAKLLKPFGFQHKDDTIYVVPQTGMAFVIMPTVKNVLHTMRAVKENGIYFKGSTLHAHVMCSFIANTPFRFYESLMKLMKSHVVDDGVRTVLLKNISQSEIRDLREALKKVSSIRNYLPLLNKLIIEFESVCDADRFGVWHSLLKQAPRHEVHRLKIPNTCYRTPPPRFPENALPDIKDVVFGATIPLIKNVPQGSISPFWVTMRTSPFLFPTVSPWFIIPDYLTVRRTDDIEKASVSKFPTIMLTGLPEGNYQHEDVAKLVWRYFPKQNLHSLYYNVIVLTLQRRAFVFFADWTTCCDFVRDHLKNPVTVKFCTLSVHFVLQHMNPESSEERMYRSLMKWTNAGVPELKSLEERLLCVEFSYTSVALVRKVIEVVASIATFVSFLPLANRICIEMADSSSVTQVVNFAPAFFEKHTWMKVKSFEPVKSLKERLRDSTEFTVNFKKNTISVKAKSPAVKCHIHSHPSKLSVTGSQAALPTSRPRGFNISASVTAGPSAKKKKRRPKKRNTSSQTATGRGAPQRMDQDDFTDDSFSVYLPFAYLFEEQNFCGYRTRTRLSSPAHEREKITSAATVKSSRETHPNPLRQETQDTESAEAKSDHKVSAESQTKIETSSEMRPPPQGHEVELSQAQSLDTDCDVNTLKDQKERKQEGKEDDVNKHSEVEEDERENYQIFNSLDEQTDEQMDDGDQVCSSETQLTGPEGSQTLLEENYQALDSLTDEGKFLSNEDSEMETNSSFQVLDSVSEDQAATRQEDSRLVQDDGPKVKQLSEEDAKPAVHKSDGIIKDAVDKKTDNKEQFQVLDTGSKQGPRGKGDGKKKEQKEEEIKVKTVSAESCKTSKDVENPDGRISNEDQPLQERDSKDTLKGPASDVTEQETFEMLDSIDDHTATLDDNQKLETPSEQIYKEDIRPKGEEEDTYQVIDTVEDQLMKSEVDSNKKSSKKEEATARKDDRPSKRSGPTTSASKSEEEKSPKKQDRTVKKYETRTKMGTSAAVTKKDKEVTEEVVYQVVDSVEDEPVQDATATERSGRRRSTRGKKEDKITSKPEEDTYKILDSVEDEAADDEPTITTRSTRGKRERTTKKDASIEKTQKEDTPTRRRHTPARESQERNREKTPKREEKVPPEESTPTKKKYNVAREVSDQVATCEICPMEDKVVKQDRHTAGGKGKRGRPKKAPPKESTPTKKKDIAARKVSEDDANYEISSTEDGVVKHDQPAPGGKGKRGRPKKQVKTTKKDKVTLKANKDASEEVAGEAEATYLTLDSVEEGMVDDQLPTGQSAKRKHVNDSEESMNFVTVDEVGEVEEEEKVVTPRKRGRTKKRSRQTPVRKSTRGKKVSTKGKKEAEKEPDEADLLPPMSRDASSSFDKVPSTLSSDCEPEIQKTEVEATGQTDINAGGQEPRPEDPKNQRLEGFVEKGEAEKEGRSRVDRKAVSKQRAELVEPEAKRSCSRPPCVSADFKLPAFNPNSPLGQDFVVPASGYFCNLCFDFYESTAKDLHCSSQRHYDNLQKHYQELQQKPSRSSTQSSQGSVSK